MVKSGKLTSVEKYRDWLNQCRMALQTEVDDLAEAGKEIVAELEQMAGKEKQIEDAFYRELSFGTGGLRGILGAGTNRMNVYTVAKASQGLASYVCREYTGDRRRIAISYDSRHKSHLFAQVAAGVFAANGIEAYLYSRLMPTPCLSYAVRALDCAAGVMITASHNPAKYNGYKVYGEDGCQITLQAAEEIQRAIEEVDPFEGVRLMSQEGGRKCGKIREIPEAVLNSYLAEVKAQSVLGEGKAQSGQEERRARSVLGEGKAQSVPRKGKASVVPKAGATGQEVMEGADGGEVLADKTIRIVYTPLHGSGLESVLRVLSESGYTNVSVVEAQREPDGDFPTCPYPNPEMPEALQLGIQEAGRTNANLVLATDPDCDRVGAAVRNEEGSYVLLSGNEMGLLLLSYLCRRRLALGTMPEHPVFVKTIVTTDLAKRIASDYGVATVDVLTGFKYIGEQIGLLEKEGRRQDYLFGFEDSYGYLAGTYVRDKDGVLGAFLICEMAAYYHTQGSDLLRELERIYQTYGYCYHTLHSYELEGSSGMKRMQEIMARFRTWKLSGSDSGGATENLFKIGGRKVTACVDYAGGVDGLPQSDVLKFILEDGSSAVIRPSGTEPKLKLYLSVLAENQKSAGRLEQDMVLDLETVILEK